MNAVERLLSHGERVVVFFDEVLAPQGWLDPRTAESVHRNLATYTDGGPFAPPAFELKTAPARYRKALTADPPGVGGSAGNGHRWQSRGGSEK